MEATANAVRSNNDSDSAEGERTLASERVARAAHERIDQAAEVAAAAEIAARDKAETAGNRAREVAEKAESRRDDVMQQAKTSIEENPLAAAGAAFAIGFVLSAMIRR